MSDRDWREWAYLDASRWPEAIPEMGPKREYGPYPWGQKTHHDPHDVDDYPNSHPDAASCGDTYLGDVCPRCGVPLRWDEEVYTIGGTRGVFHEVDELDSPTPAYHIECYRDRQAEIHGLENTSLEDFCDG